MPNIDRNNSAKLLSSWHRRAPSPPAQSLSASTFEIRCLLTPCIPLFEPLSPPHRLSGDAVAVR